MIDTHCHLYSEEFANDIDQVMERASSLGVTRFYMPAIDKSTHPAMLSLEARYPGKCFSMIGLHPCSVKENFEEELHAVGALLEERPFAAIGETGLDFYWDKTHTREQYLALEQQAVWALKYKLPIVLHTRDAMDETIEMIGQYKKEGIRGIFHCFGGTRAQAEKIIELGFLLGIGGVVTYKKSGLDEVLKNISLDNIVLETDAPYLTPVPYRGKRNESSYLPIIAQKLAEVYAVDIGEITRITTANALAVFGK